MDRDTVVNLAREASLNISRDSFGLCIDLHGNGDSVKSLTRFATLVRNAALEEAAKVCDERGERNRVAAGFPNGDRHEFYCADDIRALKE